MSLSSRDIPSATCWRTLNLEDACPTWLLRPSRTGQNMGRGRSHREWLFLVDNHHLVTSHPDMMSTHEPIPIPAVWGRQCSRKRVWVWKGWECFLNLGETTVFPWNQNKLAKYFALIQSYISQLKKTHFVSKTLPSSIAAWLKGLLGWPGAATRCPHLSRLAWEAQQSPDKLLSSPEINNHKQKYLCLLWGFVCA